MTQKEELKYLREAVLAHATAVVSLADKIPCHWLTQQNDAQIRAARSLVMKKRRRPKR